MHQLWQHPNGTYYVLYGPRLKRRVSTREKGRSRAEAYLAQFIAGTADPQPEQPSVAEILEGYRDDRLPDVRSKDALRYAVAALLPRLGSLLPDHLTPTAVKRYARERGAKPGTILREVGVLRAALEWAVEHKWLAAAPIIRNPVPTPRGRQRWITQDEARLLIPACTEIHVRHFTMLALMTVPRMSALLEAKLEQVNWTRCFIDYGEGHGNKRRAIAPLNDDAIEALKLAEKLSCSGYIIEYHGRPVKTVKKGFALACKRAGLADVTPHVLRHSGASWMVEAGVPDEEVARMLGDTPEMVRKVYGHFRPEYLRRAANALQLSAPAA